jgi:hypothetical protein
MERGFLMATNTILHRLARFARDLTPGAIPANVMERARLQHIGFAAAVRRVRDLDVARTLAAGVTTQPRDTVRLHAALGGGFGWDDHLFAGHTSPGGVSAAWALAKGHTIEELLCATVAANEVAGRLGAALLLGPTAGEALGPVHALAAATAAARLEGLDASEMAHAMALSLRASAVIPFGATIGVAGTGAKAIGAAVVHGFDAVQQVKNGEQGQLDIVEATGGVLDSGCWLPLRAAFTGLGKAWLTTTLSYKLLPAADPHQAALQAVDLVLKRHIKAADKRLRGDQILDIEIAMGAPGWGLARRSSAFGGAEAVALPYALERAVGALVVAHELGEAQLGQAWWNEHGDAAMNVASRVRLVHDWGQTMGIIQALVDVFAPLLAGVRFSELRQVAKRSVKEHGNLPAPGVADLLVIAKARPDRLMERIRYASGDLADARVDEWQLRFGAQVRVGTIRGGSWPSSQPIAIASPGWSWAETRDLVIEKYAGDDGAAMDRVQRALKATGTNQAKRWVKQLLM